MLSLEQIKLLEQKVEHALKKITDLQNHNAQLTAENDDLKVEVELLREQCERLENDDAKIEQGILGLLDKLNTVEDTIRQTQEPTQLNSAPTEVYNQPQTNVVHQENTMLSPIHQNEEVNTAVDSPSEEVTQETSQEASQEASQEQQHSEYNVASNQGMLNHATQSAQLDIF